MKTKSTFNEQRIRKTAPGVFLVLVLFQAVSLAAHQPLDPMTIPKYVTPLHIPPVMPLTSNAGGVDYYEVAVRQFQQQILPPGAPPTTFPMTTVWGYVPVNASGAPHSPAPTFEATVGTPVRVKWINGLVDGLGNFLPHLLEVTQDIHWANPPGGNAGRDSEGQAETPYTGPVPLVTHLHGAHSGQESDGYPEAWYLPAANNIPPGYATTGTYYDIFITSAPSGPQWEPGAAVFDYTNDQRATTLWYHDHALGMTRLNNYAGVGGGLYLLRGGPSDLTDGSLPSGNYEIPIVIQDRSFNKDGSLLYRPAGQEVHEKFHGNTIVVNGNTWPYLNVEQRRYRFRILNASQSRELELEMARRSPDGISFRPFWLIGADGGFLPAPEPVSQVVLGIAERADVIVDFTSLAVGTEIYLLNDGDKAKDETTGQVMKFVVVAAASEDTSTPPNALVLPAITPLGEPTYVRKVSLNGDAILGVVDPDTGLPIEKEWPDAITEDPDLGSTEIWEIHNFTDDTHPIHVHLVQFEIIDRQNLMTGVTLPPEPGESGTKDTLLVYGEEIARIKAHFDIPGLFVWHCHILEHEDDQMMRPYMVGPDTPPPVPVEVIVDNLDAGSTSSVGTWNASTALPAQRWGANYFWSTTSGGSFTFMADLVAGTYNVYEWHTAASNRPTAVSHEIRAGVLLLDTVAVNQQLAGGQWNLLGTHSFSGPASMTILTAPSGATIADAVRFEPIAGP